MGTKASNVTSVSGPSPKLSPPVGRFAYRDEPAAVALKRYTTCRARGRADVMAGWQNLVDVQPHTKRSKPPSCLDYFIFLSNFDNLGGPLGRVRTANPQIGRTPVATVPSMTIYGTVESVGVRLRRRALVNGTAVNSQTSPHARFRRSGVDPCRKKMRSAPHGARAFPLPRHSGYRGARSVNAASAACSASAPPPRGGDFRCAPRYAEGVGSGGNVRPLSHQGK
jgi:hypothetical protein